MQDYLSAAESSVVKLEYFDGDIISMPGGTPEHAAIAAETIIRIGSILMDTSAAARSTFASPSTTLLRRAIVS